MNEFIEKLIGRLEDLQQYQIEKYTKSLDEGNLACIYDKTDIEDAKVSVVWKVLDIINQLAEEHKGGWIPCSEMLPEEDGRYLVTWKEDWGNGRFEYFVFRCEYARGEWSIQEKDERYNSSVIAWQPLPAPYQPKGE